MGRCAPWLVAVALFLASQGALACPVCFAPKNEENQNAFILMTGFLTVLPLGLIGGAVFWYKRRVQALEQRTRAERRRARLRGQKGTTAAQSAAGEAGAGQVLKAPHDYFGRSYAGTPKAR